MAHVPGRLAVVLVTLMIAGATAAIPTTAATPTYPRVALGASVSCRSEDGSLVHQGRAWTTRPLVRAPLYAPVTFWLEKGNVPVVPYQSRASINAAWRTTDSGKALSGHVTRQVVDRPTVGGPAMTYAGRTVACRWSTPPGTRLGSFVVSTTLARRLGLPASTVGRTVAFTGGGETTAVTERYLFPLTATKVAVTRATPMATAYGQYWFARPWSADPLSTQTVNGGIECLRLSDRSRVYKGTAWSLTPLQRNHTWSPIAFFLSDGRVLRPDWFWSYTGDAQWRTVDSLPAQSGTYSAYLDGRPSGYAELPPYDAAGVECRWDNPLTTVTTVTAALVEQLGLPPDLVGRRVELLDEYSQTYAYVPSWMFLAP